jgi:hypothetical protein
MNQLEEIGFQFRVIGIHHHEVKCQKVRKLSCLWHKIGVEWLPDVKEPSVMLKIPLPHLRVVEFERLKTILGKVQNELLFEKISPRVFFHDPLKRPGAKKHLVTVCPRDPWDTLLLQKIIHFGEALAVQTKDVVSRLACKADLSGKLFLKVRGLIVESGGEVRKAQGWMTANESKISQGVSKDPASENPKRHVSFLSQAKKPILRQTFTIPGNLLLISPTCSGSRAVWCAFFRS